MLTDVASQEIPFLGRLILIKGDSRFLPKRILRLFLIVYEYFSLIKNPVPRWVLFCLIKAKGITFKFFLTQAYNWKI